MSRDAFVCPRSSERSLPNLCVKGVVWVGGSSYSLTGTTVSFLHLCTVDIHGDGEVDSRSIDAGALKVSELLDNAVSQQPLDFTSSCR